MQILIADFVNQKYHIHFSNLLYFELPSFFEQIFWYLSSCGKIIAALCDIQSTWVELGASCMQQLQKKAKFRGVIFDNGPVLPKYI